MDGGVYIKSNDALYYTQSVVNINFRILMLSISHTALSFGSYPLFPQRVKCFVGGGSCIGDEAQGGGGE